jgi:hypothetical protein
MTEGWPSGITSSTAPAVGDDHRELAVDDPRDRVDLALPVHSDPRDVGDLVGLGQEMQLVRRQLALLPW